MTHRYRHQNQLTIVVHLKSVGLLCVSRYAVVINLSLSLSIDTADKIAFPQIQTVKWLEKSKKFAENKSIVSGWIIIIHKCTVYFEKLTHMHRCCNCEILWSETHSNKNNES